MLENPVSLDILILEIQKCCLICKNCHAELHANKSSLPIILPKVDMQFLLDIDKPKTYTIICPQCKTEYIAKNARKKYCSTKCMRFGSRKAIRPEKAVIENQVKEFGFVGTGKIYGVTDNAIRKWLGLKK